jgi:hypothetical protein
VRIVVRKQFLDHPRGIDVALQEEDGKKEPKKQKEHLLLTFKYGMERSCVPVA